MNCHQPTGLTTVIIAKPVVGGGFLLQRRVFPLHRRTGVSHTRGFGNIMLIHPGDERVLLANF